MFGLTDGAGQKVVDSIAQGDIIETITIEGELPDDVRLQATIDNWNDVLGD